MSNPLPILWLEELRLEHLPRVGGKLARLGELAARGYPVPPGFALPVEAFALAVPAAVRAEIAQVVREAPGDLAGLEATAARARELVERQPLSRELAEAVGRAYRQLGERLGSEADVLTAVRSSGVGEDGETASFAGQFETYLGVRGAAAVLEHVRKCWASQYTARALDYCRRKGIVPDGRGIAVGVLALVEARSSGIAFSVNPVDGNRDQVVVEANWGLGESVVSGRVTPDLWLVDKRSGAIVEERIADKGSRTVLDPAAGRVVEEPLSEALRRRPCLSHDEVRHVAEVVTAIERQEGVPQDLEWVLDARLDFPESFFVLQHRPVTAAGPAPGEPDGKPFDPVEYALRNVFGVPMPGAR